MDIHKQPMICTTVRFASRNTVESQTYMFPSNPLPICGKACGPPCCMIPENVACGRLWCGCPKMLGGTSLHCLCLACHTCRISTGGKSELTETQELPSSAKIVSWASTSRGLTCTKAVHLIGPALLSPGPISCCRVLKAAGSMV